MTAPDELITYYRRLREHGLNDSHSGNASVRDGDVVWVTPSGACAETLQKDDLVRCGIDGSRGDGASLDAPLHIQVYRRNTATRAVLHSHGPHSVALTLDGKPFVPADFEGGLYFPRVPVVDLAYDEYVERSPELVATALSDHRVVVVRGHGVYAQGENLDQAYKWTCSLESSAKTAFIARLAGTLEK